MKTINLITFFLSIILSANAQDHKVSEVKVNKYVIGDLYQPQEKSDKLAIIIGGSGDINRDGNQSMIKTDAYKKLATYLANNGTACFTYDKRVLRIKELDFTEADLRFENLVTDVKSIYQYFKADKDYDDVILIGHSQGSLVSLIAAQQIGDAVISMAGSGVSIDNILHDQLKKQFPQSKKAIRKALDSLKIKGKVKDYPPQLFSIFRPQLQPFLHSWMQYDPQKLIAQLDLPILIINGDQDLQVDVDQAKKLKNAQPEAKLMIIENMNHILKESKAKDLTNQQTYQKPELPLVDELKEEVLSFINAL
jgi:alpha-beta hydrolase superfamily lysophospholipase